MSNQGNWPLYTLEEVSVHNSEDDAWFIFNRSVYNATQHLREIKELKTSTFLAIMRVLGTDCTEEMIEIRHSATALAMIDSFKIGEIKSI